VQPEQYRYFYELEDKHWWFAGMRDIFFRIIGNIYKPGAGLQILDVGCGAGLNIKELEKFGRVIGIDIEGQALELCQQRSITKLCLGSGLDLPFKNETFDLVTAFNLVEHVQEDAFLIKELARVCKKSGRIILATSAFNFLWSRHDLINEHKRRYTKRTLQFLVNRQNFKIEKLTYTNFILFPLIWAGITWQNLLKCFSAPMVNKYYSIQKPVNKILLWILRLESWILSKFNAPFGVSLLCVVRKT
jgi:ubiquinone/menaquinone biosynthesis C-methylase UbiE